MKKKILLIVLILIIGNIICSKKTSAFSQIDFTKADSLMIVAHPDDETIWGGNHLKNGRYLVVCLTNGDNEIRSQEFHNVIGKTNNQGVILKFPDKTNGKRDTWNTCYKTIDKEIKRIIKVKKWKEVITHNPAGEYGHQHHKMTSTMVTTVMKENYDLNKLAYFGKYYKKKDFLEKSEVEKEFMNPLHKKQREEKQKLLNLYPSQKKVEKKLAHMMPYENWIPYNEWK